MREKNMSGFMWVKNPVVSWPAVSFPTLDRGTALTRLAGVGAVSLLVSFIHVKILFGQLQHGRLQSLENSPFSFLWAVSNQLPLFY